MSGRPTSDAHHDPRPDQLVNRLRQAGLLAKLSPDDLRAVLGLVRVRSVLAGEVVVTAGSSDTNLYLLRKGKLLVRLPSKDNRDPVVRAAQIGELLNELAFVSGHPSEATIEAVTPAQLWYIAREDFQKLLRRRPQMRGALAYNAEEQRYVAQRKRFDTQRQGEVVLWFSRRHRWVFARRLGLPLVLLILSIGSWFVAFQQPLLSTFVPAFSVASFLIALIIFLWLLVDWLNDYYVITDQRLIHRERILVLYDAQEEVPLVMVQNVTVKRPSALSSLLDVGDVLIETMGAQANIQFDWVSKPDNVATLILEQQARARAEKFAMDRAKLRTELRWELGILPRPPAPEAPKVATRKTPAGWAAQQRKALLRTLRNELLPRMRLVREDDVVVFRKHWLVLVRETLLPASLLLIYLAALAIIATSTSVLRQFLFGTSALLVVALIGFVLLLWLIWRYEDWRNDLNMISKDQVIDYKRAPFGLGSTTQRTASLSNIQNVSATTKGLLDNLFNLGDVIIRTAGVENELSFLRVWNPRGVQREVLMRVEAYRIAKQEEESNRRWRELSALIGIYDELRQIHPTSNTL
jgi:CRP-like cAMP-binding protein/membrane protein YdbS with pleckstrin-like domain